MPAPKTPATPPPSVLREAAAALDAQASAEESAAAPAAPAAPVATPPPPLPATAKMLKKPYNHPTFDKTVSFRVDADCWSATGIYLGQDTETPPGETLVDLADALKAQEAAAAASQKATK